MQVHKKARHTSTLSCYRRPNEEPVTRCTVGAIVIDPNPANQDAFTSDKEFPALRRPDAGTHRKPNIEPPRSRPMLPFSTTTVADNAFALVLHQLSWHLLLETLRGKMPDLA